MIIINLYGGPGAGKTTTAYYLAYRLKKAGYRAELVGEAARELIYDHQAGVTPPSLLDNQVYVSGLQYERIIRLARHGVEVAICDSPLKMGLVYAEDIGQIAYTQLKDLVNALSLQFESRDYFLHPDPGSYDQESRRQTEDQARALDGKIRALASITYSPVFWGDEQALADAIIDGLKRNHARSAA